MLQYVRAYYCFYLRRSCFPFQVQKTGQIFGQPASDVRGRVFPQRSVVRLAADRPFHPGPVTGTPHPGNNSSRRFFRHA